MKTRTTYWLCQILGWGAYSAIGILSRVQMVGWGFDTVAGYVLFFAYSIALTDLLRREIRRRDWLAAWNARSILRLVLAALAVAAIQTFLVTAIDLTFMGRRSEFFVHPWYVL